MMQLCYYRVIDHKRFSLFVSTLTLMVLDRPVLGKVLHKRGAMIGVLSRFMTLLTKGDVIPRNTAL